MKDYRLSEIKEICKHRKAKFSRPCDDCECVEFCGIIDAYNGMPIDICNRLNIEPRDMIELPYKDKIDEGLYKVLWRQNGINGVLISIFNTEPEADAFIRS